MIDGKFPTFHYKFLGVENTINSPLSFHSIRLAYRNQPLFEMQRPNHPTPVACRVCDKVFNSDKALVWHFSACHMVDGKIVVPGNNSSLNFNRYSSHEENQFSFPSLIQPNFSSQTMASKSPISISIPNLVAQSSRNNYSTSWSPAKLEKNPITNPPFIRTPTTRHDYMFRLPSLASSSSVPLGVKNYDFKMQKSSDNIVGRILKKDCSSSRSTKFYINQLDQSIMEIIDVDESDEDDDPNKLDLTLKL